MKLINIIKVASAVLSAAIIVYEAWERRKD